jgi:site-specific recombinase XerD
VDLSRIPLFPSIRGDANHVSQRTFARLVKRIAELLGKDPAKYAGHSTRRGLATSLAENGADIRKIATQLRHRDIRSSSGYIEETEAFENNPLAKI